MPHSRTHIMIMTWQATVVHRHEDKPVHPATVPAPPAQRDSPIEEEVDEYEEDW